MASSSAVARSFAPPSSSQGGALPYDLYSAATRDQPSLLTHCGRSPLSTRAAMAGGMAAISTLSTLAAAPGLYFGRLPLPAQPSTAAVSASASRAAERRDREPRTMGYTGDER